MLNLPKSAFPVVIFAFAVVDAIDQKLNCQLIINYNYFSVLQILKIISLKYKIPSTGSSWDSKLWKDGCCVPVT